MYDQFRGVLVAPRSDADVQIRFVEIFTDGLVVHWTALVEIPLPRTDQAEGEQRARIKRHNELVAISVTDDIGTQYLGGGGGLRGSSGFYRGDTRFGTPVPRHASTLTVTTHSDSVTMRLSDLAAPPY
jgi:hypothetical protein